MVLGANMATMQCWAPYAVSCALMQCQHPHAVLGALEKYLENESFILFTYLFKSKKTFKLYKNSANSLTANGTDVKHVLFQEV